MEHLLGEWTSRDEAALAELSGRKAVVMASRMAAVEKVAAYLLSDTAGRLADALVAYADEIRDALAPFDSGARPSPSTQPADKS